MKPSKFHHNKNLANWLVYKIGDKFLENKKKLYKGNLVDLGCGTAPFKEYFLQYCDSYVGVDWTDTLHDSQADIVSDLNASVALDDEVADTVVSLSVMEHLYEPQMFLNEAYRILKKDGNIILQVPWQWWVHEAPHDYFRYTPYALRYMFKKAGFQEVEVEAMGGFFISWLMKINYFTARFKYVGHSKIIETLVTVILAPFWTFNQLIAPLLDHLDRHKEAETQGYFVTARKL